MKKNNCNFVIKKKRNMKKEEHSVMMYINGFFSGANGMKQPEALQG